MNTPDSRIAAMRRAFRALHASGCFVIPNPWDVGSARYLQGQGFQALATTSSGYAWSQGRLPDEQYDEFVFRGFLASDLEPGQTLYFPVVQECEKGVHRWIEIPAPGKDYPEPAPGLKLLPKR